MMQCHFSELMDTHNLDNEFVNSKAMHVCRDNDRTRDSPLSAADGSIEK